MRKIEDMQRQRAIRLLLAGRSVRETARMVGIARETVIAIRDTAKEIKPTRARKP